MISRMEDFGNSERTPMSEASDWESLKEVAFAGDLSENKVENNSLAKNLKQKIERARRGENVVLTLEDVSGELQHSGEPIYRGSNRCTQDKLYAARQDRNCKRMRRVGSSY